MRTTPSRAFSRIGRLVTGQHDQGNQCCLAMGCGSWVAFMGCRAAVDDANLESGCAVIEQTIQPASQAQPVHRCATHRPPERARLRTTARQRIGIDAELICCRQPAALRRRAAQRSAPEQPGARPSPRRCTPRAGGRCDCPAVLRCRPRRRACDSGPPAFAGPASHAGARPRTTSWRLRRVARRVAIPNQPPRRGAWGRFTFPFDMLRPPGGHVADHGLTAGLNGDVLDAHDLPSGLPA